MDDYFSWLLQIGIEQENPKTLLYLAMLFTGRMFPIIAMAPFFGAKVLPHPVKVVLGVCLFFIFLPQLIGQTVVPMAFNITFFIALIQEIFVGSIIGFLFSIPFIIVQNAGILIDHQRGGASLMVNDPTIQNQSSPLGTLFNLILLYSFFQIDGLFQALDIVSRSYQVLPPHHFLSPAFFQRGSEVVSHIVGLLGHVMILSTQLAAPPLVMILMTDFFLGVANRLAPQVQITFLGMPLKSLLGLVMVFFGWALFYNEILLQTQKALAEISRLVLAFAP